MSDEKTTQGETPEKPAETVAAVEQEPVKSEKPAGDEFDKERAMETIHKLRDFEKQAKKELKELETLRAEKQEREQAEMTELEKAKKRIAELEKQSQDAQRAIWQRDAAAEANLPSIFADRVKGETLEEMKADAVKLAEALPKQSNSKPSLKPTNPANGERKESEAEKRERLFGPQGQNYFNMDNIVKAGGGVWEITPSNNEAE